MGAKEDDRYPGFWLILRRQRFSVSSHLISDQNDTLILL